MREANLRKRDQKSCEAFPLWVVRMSLHNTQLSRPVRQYQSANIYIYILYLSFSFSCFNLVDNRMERQRSPLESDTVNEPASVESIFFLSLINITWMTMPALLLSECSTLLVWMHWPLCKQCNHSQGGWSLLCTSGQLARLPLIPRAPNTWGSQY